MSNRYAPNNPERAVRISPVAVFNKVSWTFRIPFPLVPSTFIRPLMLARRRSAQAALSRNRRAPRNSARRIRSGERLPDGAVKRKCSACRLLTAARDDRLRDGKIAARLPENICGEQNQTRGKNRK